MSIFKTKLDALIWVLMYSGIFVCGGATYAWMKGYTDWWLPLVGVAISTAGFLLMLVPQAYQRESTDQDQSSNS